MTRRRKGWRSALEQRRPELQPTWGTVQGSRRPILPTVIVSEDFCAGRDAYCCNHKADHRRPLVDTSARRRSIAVVPASPAEAA